MPPIMKLMHTLWLSQSQLPHGSMPSQSPKRSERKLRKASFKKCLYSKWKRCAGSAVFTGCWCKSSFSSHPLSIIHQSFELVLTRWRITSILLLLSSCKPSLLVLLIVSLLLPLSSHSLLNKAELSTSATLGWWRLNPRPHLLLFSTVGGLVRKWAF